MTDDLRQGSTPVVLAQDRTLPVVDALAGLFLGAGLQQGSTVEVEGTALLKEVAKIGKDTIYGSILLTCSVASHLSLSNRYTKELRALRRPVRSRRDMMKHNSRILLSFSSSILSSNVSDCSC